MPIQADAITHRKLVLAKNMYRRAVNQSANEHSPLDRMFAVLTFDLAIETVLKAALSALDPSVKLESELNALIQKCNTALATNNLPATPDARQILDVRKIRNAVQHEARIPNPAEVSDSRTYARDFLDKFVSQVWGLSFDRVRLSNMITYPQARKFLDDAEEALDKGDYRGAAQLANAALTFSLRFVQSTLVGEPGQFENAFTGEKDWSGDGRRMEAAITRMQETVVLLALGLDVGQRRRCEDLAGHAMASINGKMYYQGTKEDLTVDEAEWVIAYCFDSMAEIEARVGGIETPYGKDWFKY